MDFNRFKPLLSNSLGQSTVEYIMLFAMIALIVTTVFKSDAFKGIFGQEGVFAKTYKEEIEYSYRHALRGRKAHSEPNYQATHDSYFFNGETRFFGAKDAYPRQ